MVEQRETSEPTPRGSGFLSRIRFGIAWWAALMAAWLLFVESLALAEVLAGVVASAVAAGTAEAVRERGYVRFSPRARWLVRVPRVGWQILTDCWILGGALVEQIRGRRTVRGVMYRVPIAYGDDSSQAAARRALLNFAVSITPNSYVLDLDEDTSTALVHQLVPARLDPLLEQCQPDDLAIPPHEGP
jgi:multisubunit Na+/H+ antiporter MnhE subunit